MKKLIIITLAALVAGFVVSRFVFAQNINDLLNNPADQSMMFNRIQGNNNLFSKFMDNMRTNRNAQYMMMNYMMEFAAHDSLVTYRMRKGIMGYPGMMNYMMGGFINRTDSDTALARRFGYMMMGHRNMIGFMDNMISTYGRNYMMNPSNRGSMPMYGYGYMNGHNYMNGQNQRYGQNGMHNGNYINGQNHMNGYNHMGMNGNNNMMNYNK